MLIRPLPKPSRIPSAKGKASRRIDCGRVPYWLKSLEKTDISLRYFADNGLNIKGDKGEPIMHPPFFLSTWSDGVSASRYSDVYFKTSSRMYFVPTTSRIFERSV